MKYSWNLKSYSSAKYFTPSKHSMDMKTWHLCERVNYYSPHFIHWGSRSAERLKVPTETTQLVRVCTKGTHILSSLRAQPAGSAPLPQMQPDYAATAIHSWQWHPVPILCLFLVEGLEDWKRDGKTGKGLEEARGTNLPLEQLTERETILHMTGFLAFCTLPIKSNISGDWLS